MSLTATEVNVVLNANATGFARNMQQAQNQIAGLSRTAEASNVAMGMMGKSAAGFGQTASGLLVPVGQLSSNIESIAPAAQNAGAQVEKMGRHMHGTQQMATGFIGSLQDMHTQMNLMFGGMAMTAVFTAPFVMGMKTALKTSIGFEDAFAGVRKTVDASEAEFKQLESNFRGMAKEVPIAAEEFARIGELAGQLGVRGVQEITAFTDVIAKLGVTTNLSTEEGSTALARFANIMQMPIMNADRLGSTIVDLGNNLATTEREITEFALRIAAAGRQVGLSEAEVLAFGGALSSVGVEAEAGGSSISRAFIALANAVATGGETLKMFASVAGLSIGEFKRLFQEDAANATVVFIKGLRRVQEAGGNVFAVLDELGLNEIRVRDALLRIAGADDLLTKSLQISTNAWTKNNALIEEATKRYATSGSQIKIAINNFIELARTFGDTLAPYLNMLISGFTTLTKWLQGIPKPIQLILVVFSALLAAIGPLMLGLSMLGAATLGLASAQTMLAVAMKAALGPIGLIVGAITLLSTGLAIFAAKNNMATAEMTRQAEEARKLSQEQEAQNRQVVTLADQYDLLTQKLKTTKKGTDEYKGISDELNTVKGQLVQIMPDVVSAYDKEGKAVDIDTQKLRDNTNAAREAIAIRNAQALGAAMARMREAESDLKAWQEKVNRIASEGKIGLVFEYEPLLGLKADAVKQARDDYARLQNEVLQIAKKTIMPKPVVPGGGTPGDDAKKQAEAIDMYTFKLRQLDNQWKIYTLTTKNAADSVQYLTQQKDNLLAKLGVVNPQITLLKEKFDAMDVATKGWTDKSRKLKEQLDDATITQLELQKSLDDTKRSIEEQSSAINTYTFRLKQLDNQWEMYTLTTNETTKSTQYLAKQEEQLHSKLSIVNQQVELLKAKFEAMDVATKGWTEKSRALKEQLDEAVISQLRLTKTIEEQIGTLDTWEKRWKAINKTLDEGDRNKGLQIAVLGALEDKWKSGTLTIGDVKAVAGLPGLAAGGTVMSPGMALVGERGPEILSLQRGATVAPMDKAGNYMPVTVNVYGSVGVDDIAEEIVDAIRRKTGANY